MFINPFIAYLYTACPYLPSIANATLSYSITDLEVGTRATYQCDEGLVPTEPVVISCTPDLNWNGTGPNCTLVCEHPTHFINGTFEPDRPQYVPGDIVTFTCPAGYDLNGISQLQCNETGAWNDTFPTCLVSTTSTTPTTTTTTLTTTTTTPTTTTTALTILSTTTSVHFTTTTRPRTNRPAPMPLFIMPCICYHVKTFTNMTQSQILAHLEKETAIQVNTTARYRGKYESRDDPRPSSKLVGLIGTAIFASMFGLIALTDVRIVWIHLKAAISNKYKLFHTRKVKPKGR